MLRHAAPELLASRDFLLAALALDFRALSVQKYPGDFGVLPPGEGWLADKDFMTEAVRDGRLRIHPEMYPKVSSGGGNVPSATALRRDAYRVLQTGSAVPCRRSSR